MSLILAIQVVLAVVVLLTAIAFSVLVMAPQTELIGNRLKWLFVITGLLFIAHVITTPKRLVAAVIFVWSLITVLWYFLRFRKRQSFVAYVLRRDVEQPEIGVQVYYVVARLKQPHDIPRLKIYLRGEIWRELPDSGYCKFIVPVDELYEVTTAITAYDAAPVKKVEMGTNKNPFSIKI